MDVSITLAHEQVSLMPERAVYWPREHTLFVADVHFGKAAAFRAWSVPVPEGGLADDLARLSHCIGRVKAKRIVFLGDVLHARQGRVQTALTQVREWRALHACQQFHMVRGNHDLQAGDPPQDWGMSCADDGEVLGPFVLCHVPCESRAGYVLAGHVHPAVALRGKGGLFARLPCFVAGPQRMILPAFGHFTGMSQVPRAAGERIFCVADDEVIAVR